jgi:hypothetical protein
MEGIVTVCHPAAHDLTIHPVRSPSLLVPSKQTVPGA